MKIVVNASHREEIRMAIVKGQTLDNLFIEPRQRIQQKSSIYVATVTRAEPSLDAFFVKYGPGRDGFLPLKNVSPEYYPQDHNENTKINMRDILAVGQKILIQVETEERNKKGAALTTFISLAGCYLVLMPNNSRAGGISRRIDDNEERETLRENLAKLPLPEGMGVIVRTAGVGKSYDELAWDLGVLLNQWNRIKAAAEETQAPALIYQEGDVVIRAIRDYFKGDVDEVLIDDKETYLRAKAYVDLLRPDVANRVKHYQDPMPLFSRFQLESQIANAFHRDIQLPSGGAIVIDHTEALISIDVNSARATKGTHIEETALQTNIEAAREVAKQLRIRDLGGLVVIDFIDMLPARNQREVENTLKEALKVDRARVQVGKISRFGLLEMSRQRLGNPLMQSVLETCPQCNGHGVIRSTESLGLVILRVFAEEAMKDKTARVVAQVPVDVATFLLNEKRNDIAAIEENNSIKIILIPNRLMQRPHYEIVRLRTDDSVHKLGSSHELLGEIKDESNNIPQKNKQLETPVLTEVNSGQSRNTNKNVASGGIIKRLINSIFSPQEENTSSITPKSKDNTQQNTAAAQDETKISRNQKSTRNYKSQNRKNTNATSNNNKQRRQQKSTSAYSKNDNAAAEEKSNMQDGNKKQGQQRNRRGRRNQSGNNQENKKDYNTTQPKSNTAQSKINTNTQQRKTKNRYNPQNDIAEDPIRKEQQEFAKTQLKSTQEELDYSNNEQSKPAANRTTHRRYQKKDRNNSEMNKQQKDNNTKIADNSSLPINKTNDNYFKNRNNKPLQTGQSFIAHETPTHETPFDDALSINTYDSEKIVSPSSATTTTDLGATSISNNENNKKRQASNTSRGGNTRHLRNRRRRHTPQQQSSSGNDGSSETTNNNPESADDNNT